MSVLEKKSLHQTFKIPENHSLNVNSYQFSLDDTDYSTNIIPLYDRYNKLNSEYDFDIVPGNFSTHRVYVSKPPNTITSENQPMIISDDKLTNIHEELANTKKSLNELNKKYDELKSEIVILKEYGPVLQWAKNYVDHSKNYNCN